MLARAADATIFPYTTLFRSQWAGQCQRLGGVLLSVVGGRRGVSRLAADERHADVAGDGTDQRDAAFHGADGDGAGRAEEHTSELQAHSDRVDRHELEGKGGQ